MADASESPRRPPSAHTASHLQYPTLPPLSASVQEWLSRSRPANNMTSDQHLTLPARSLGDSWADLSVSDLHSEDGSRSENTDMGSLIDPTGADDVASLDERYSSSEVGGPDDEYPPEDEDVVRDDLQDSVASQQFPIMFTQDETAIDNSNLTTRTAYRQSIDSIEFVEPDKWPERERVELKHTIHIFDDAEAAKMRESLPHNVEGAILMTTVQQTMTKGSLDLDKPYRVLYIGQPDSRNIILDKIGDVLVSSSTAGSQTSSANSSRYHVVPTSFGAGAVPNFAELLPIHVQLVVDECKDASAESHEIRPSTLHLDFKNRPACRSWWDGDQYRISSASEWTLPDVAILFVSDRDSPATIQTQHYVHTFLERHGIPAMVISEEPLWKRASEPIPLNHNSLHMCLESRHPRTGETAVLRRYPIDLKTFESITPGQLNRNLASLMDLYPKKIPKVTADAPRPVELYSSTDPEKYPRNWLHSSYSSKARELGPMLRLVTLTLISAIALSIGYAAVNTVFVSVSQWISGPKFSNTGSQLSPPLLSTSVAVLKVPQTSGSIWPAGQSCHPNSKPAAIIDHVAKLTITDSSSSGSPDVFEIQVVGDCHVVIKPPRSFVTYKKQPPFNVSARRYEQPLSYELSKLFDGVYTLRLDREDAYGLINITVSAKSKPPINQVTTVDFGTPWLKIASWRRAARKVSSQVTKDLQIAQTSLAEVYGRVSTDVQVRMGDLVKRSHFLHQDTLRRQGLLARDTVLSRSKQLSEVITRNALEQFRTVSAVVHSRSVRVNQEARGLVIEAWNRLGDSAAQVDIHSMMDRVRSAKCAALDRAQARARRVVGRRD
ncbi:uncharacterized protein N7496_006876 [Penicillium cataractarum]|uniref:Uncharacterized protein n=1 Tax=Penicillium cataractarum TaxID=2100454 RepID=A0A9W9S4C0_9EURO|nr:uncharacterized protein N7496_006876 [Penicillium cataractarum]KAJ5370784.1 hypothetical protein N7496_006876 [Penicillium cataractarum]